MSWKTRVSHIAVYARKYMAPWVAVIRESFPIFEYIDIHAANHTCWVTYYNKEGPQTSWTTMEDLPPTTPNDGDDGPLVAKIKNIYPHVEYPSLLFLSRKCHFLDDAIVFRPSTITVPIQTTAFHSLKTLTLTLHLGDLLRL